MPLKFPQRFTTSVTEKMFGSTTDLAALNVGRGRDVGLPSYNEMREFCGLRRAQTFNDFANEITSVDIRNNMQTLYTTPDDVDFYVGGILEDPVGGGMLGPTFSCVIGNQFQRTRDGDRFWFQNQSTFTPEQLAQLERVTMARILCDNGDAITTISSDAFLFNAQQSFCTTIPSMDLTPWTE